MTATTMTTGTDRERRGLKQEEARLCGRPMQAAVVIAENQRSSPCGAPVHMATAVHSAPSPTSMNLAGTIRPG